MNMRITAKLSCFLIALVLGSSVILGCSNNSATTTSTKTSTAATTTTATKTATTTTTSTTAEPAKTVTVPIGYLTFLTGAAASSGISFQRTAQMATDEINEKGIRVGNTIYKLNLIVDDSANNAQVAVQAFNKQVFSDKVKIMMVTGTGPTNAILPLADQERVILNPQASGVSVLAGHPTVFRTLQSSTEYAGAWAQWVANKYNIKTVYFLSENTAGFVSINEVFLKTFPFYGVKVIGQDTFPATTTDFAAVIDKVLAAKPDGVLMSPFAPEGNLLKQLRQRGYAGQVFASTGVDAGFISQAGNAANGVVGVIQLDIGSADIPAPINQMYEKYQKKYGSIPSGGSGATDAYTWVYIVANAIAKAGSADVAALVKVMETQTLDSPWGPVKFAGQEIFGMPHQVYIPSFVTVYSVAESKWKTVHVITPDEEIATARVLWAPSTTAK